MAKRKVSDQPATAKPYQPTDQRNVSMIMRQALVQFKLGGSGLF
jgi:hypothetical protein